MVYVGPSGLDIRKDWIEWVRVELRRMGWVGKRFPGGHAVAAEGSGGGSANQFGFQRPLANPAMISCARICAKGCANVDIHICT